MNAYSNSPLDAARFSESADRWEQHLYEFQFGKRPFDPQGPKYGISGRAENGDQSGDARAIRLDDLPLTTERCFGYWFDFGDDWYHQVQVVRMAHAISTVAYPRAPPQYPRE